LTTSTGEHWFWGGYYYNKYDKLLLDGFNLLNEEEGLKDKTILTHGMGFAHDTVLVEDSPSEIIK